MFLPGSLEEFQPQASGKMANIFNSDRRFKKNRSILGSVVKAPKVVPDTNVEQSSNPASPDFNSMLPGLTTTPLEPHHHYSAEELSMAVATSCVCALVVGFITGFLMSRRCSCSTRDDDNPYHVPYLNQLVS